MTKVTEAEIFTRALARKESFANFTCGADHDLDYVMMSLEESGGSVSIGEFKRIFNKSELKSKRQIASAVKDGVVE